MRRFTPIRINPAVHRIDQAMRNQFSKDLHGEVSCANMHVTITMMVEHKYLGSILVHVWKAHATALDRRQKLLAMGIVDPWQDTPWLHRMNAVEYKCTQQRLLDMVVPHISGFIIA